MSEKKIDKQVKSNKSVADHGEVFTSEREVNAMLDLVKDKTERILKLSISSIRNMNRNR